MGLLLSLKNTFPALIASASPLVIVLLNLGLKHEKFSSKMFLGIILALCGIYFIYQMIIASLIVELSEKK